MKDVRTARATTRPGGPAGAVRQTRSRENSRRRLVDAAREAFLERGIRDTPVELICERAGFTRGAFYSNFSSKEDLFLAVYEEVSAMATQQFVDAIGAPPAVEGPQAVQAVLREIADRYRRTHVMGEPWFVLMSEIQLQAMRQPELRPRLQAVTERTVAALVEVVEEFLAATGVRLAVPHDDVARLLLALHDHALTHNLLEGRSIDAENPFLTDLVPRLLIGLVDWSAPAS